MQESHGITVGMAVCGDGGWEAGDRHGREMRISRARSDEVPSDSRTHLVCLKILHKIPKKPAADFPEFFSFLVHFHDQIGKRETRLLEAVV